MCQRARALRLATASPSLNQDFLSTILSDPDAHPQNKRPRAREFDRRPTAALRPPCFDHDATRVRRPLQLNPCTQLMQLKRPSECLFVVVWVCWGNGGLCLCCVVLCPACRSLRPSALAHPHEPTHTAKNSRTTHTRPSPPTPTHTLTGIHARASAVPHRYVCACAFVPTDPTQ